MEPLEAYFSLEVYAYDVNAETGALPAGWAGEQHNGAYLTPQLPSIALAFQFLDFPLLLVYPSQQSRSTRSQSCSFISGKSCVLKADPEELQFLLEKMPLHISMLNVKTLPKPTLLASGSTPMFITSPAQGSPTATISQAPVRSVTLFNAEGQEAAVARVSCRLINHGSVVPSVSTLSPGLMPPASTLPSSMPRPATAPMLPQQQRPVLPAQAPAQQQQPEASSLSASLPSRPPAMFFANHQDQHHQHMPAQQQQPTAAPHAPMVAWTDANDGHRDAQQQVAAPAAEAGTLPSSVAHQLDSLQRQMQTLQQLLQHQHHNHQQQQRPQPTAAARGSLTDSELEEFLAHEAAARQAMAEQQQPRWAEPVKRQQQPAAIAKAAATTAANAARVRAAAEAPAAAAAVLAAAQRAKGTGPTIPLVKALLQHTAFTAAVRAHKDAAVGRPAAVYASGLPPRALTRGLPPKALAGAKARPAAAKGKRGKAAAAGQRQQQQADAAAAEDRQWGPELVAADQGEGHAAAAEADEHMQFLQEQLQAVQQQLQRLQDQQQQQQHVGSGKQATQGASGSEHHKQQQPAAEPTVPETSKLLFSQKQQPQQSGWVPPAAMPGYNQAFGAGYSHPAAGGFQMSSVLMWEMMSLVAMRTVLSSAVGAMSNQMTTMASQVVQQAVLPAVAQAQAQLGLAPGLPMMPAGLNPLLLLQQQQAAAAAAAAAAGAGGLQQPGLAAAWEQMMRGTAAAAAPAAANAGKPGAPGGGMDDGQFLSTGGLGDTQRYNAAGSDEGQATMTASGRRREADADADGAEAAAAPARELQERPSIHRSATVKMLVGGNKGASAPAAASGSKPAAGGGSGSGGRSPAAGSVDDEEEGSNSYSDDFGSKAATTEAAAKPSAPIGWVRSNTMAPAKEEEAKSVASSPSSYDEDYEEEEFDSVSDLQEPPAAAPAAPAPAPAAPIGSISAPRVLNRSNTPAVHGSSSGSTAAAAAAVTGGRPATRRGSASEGGAPTMPEIPEEDERSKATSSIASSSHSIKSSRNSKSDSGYSSYSEASNRPKQAAAKVEARASASSLRSLSSYGSSRHSSSGQQAAAVPPALQRARAMRRGADDGSQALDDQDDKASVASSSVSSLFSSSSDESVASSQSGSSMGGRQQQLPQKGRAGAAALAPGGRQQRRGGRAASPVGSSGSDVSLSSSGSDIEISYSTSFSPDGGATRSSSNLPASRRQYPAHRDSSKFSVTTGVEEDDASIEYSDVDYDDDEMADALDHVPASHAAAARPGMQRSYSAAAYGGSSGYQYGGSSYQYGAAAGQQYGGQAGYQSAAARGGRGKVQYQSADSDDLNMTADILDQISDLSSVDGGNGGGRGGVSRMYSARY